MKITLLLSLLLSVLVFEAGNTPFYVGVWKAHEAKTLQSLYATQGITTEERLQLRDLDFSKLVYVVREDTFATYTEDLMPEQLTFLPYKVAVLNDNTIETTHFDISQRADIKRTLTFEGDCYYVRVTQWHIKQYFCKVQ
ncbi:hypothetical protein V1358_14260 [Pseudoalteromonas sp. YIC-656]|uniref:hypothetical protein n=1 Tax=Pseudoalteromonas pernae TaxID=3118054 RepID=UPI003242A483